MRHCLSPVASTAGLAALATLSWHAGSLAASLLSPPALQDEIDDLLEVVEFVDLDDGQTGTNRTLRISGVNLQIVNDTGLTESAVGTGNLIVGYNELTPTTQHTGSHNVVVGTGHTYTSWGGIVAGRAHSVSAAFASAVGGRGNTASGEYATVAGGRQNVAAGDYALALGGRRNSAPADYASALGGGSATAGEGNTASAEYAVAVGGDRNQAAGVASVVLGGSGNVAQGEGALAAGGEGNLADGLAAAVLGGLERATTADYDVIGDGGGEDDDWAVTTVGGTSALIAQAERVGIGTATPPAPLSIVPPVDEPVALDVGGDVRIGRGEGNDKGDASEHVEIRASSGEWFVGATNDEDRPKFFVGQEAEPDGTFTLLPNGDLGLGTAAPQAALHVAREEGDALVLLEGGDKSADVGLQMKQAGDVDAQVGFFDRSFQVRFADDSVGLALDQERAEVHVNGGLQVDGAANVAGNATIDGAVGIDGSLTVAGDMTVEGDFLLLGGLLDVAGELRSSTFRLAAWGVVGQEGGKQSGSPNWSSAWDGNEGSYRITLDGASSKEMAVFVVWMSGGGGYYTARTAGTDTSLADDEVRVRFHNALFPKSTFCFFAVSE